MGAAIYHPSVGKFTRWMPAPVIQERHAHDSLPILPGSGRWPFPGRAARGRPGLFYSRSLMSTSSSRYSASTAVRNSVRTFIAAQVSVSIRRAFVRVSDSQAACAADLPAAGGLSRAHDQVHTRLS